MNLVQPFITGSGVIPNTLRCEIGVWDASPTADYYYQWMADGVDIAGAFGPTITTDETFDGVTLTCEVRADNGIGEDYAVSVNSVLCSLIEPIEVRENEYFVTTGIQANKHQTILDKRDLIVTGVGTDNRQDVMRGVFYFITGLWAENRSDVNAMPIIAVTGLQQSDTLSVLERDLGISVINSDVGVPLVTSIPQPLPIKNNNAELGVLGWETFGQATFDNHGTGVPLPVEGEFCFVGGRDVDPDGANTPYTSISQDVELWPLWLPDVDAGVTFLNYNYLQNSLNSSGVFDLANVKVEFYAADGTTLTGTHGGPGMWRGPRDVWFTRYSSAAIPPLTRFVRFVMEFSWDAINGDDHIDSFIDNIKATIRKGSALTGIDYGPDFEYWRVRFTQARSWSGSALSEVEFQSTYGGLDLATGGQVLFGSAGLGTVNGDAAFDGVLSNYWAGAENSITEGTSWVGYQMASPQRPQAINIQARPGSDALQVGSAFNVEASEDGINWITIEEYDVERLERAWNAGESRLFSIQNNTSYDFMYEAPNVVPTVSSSNNSVDDYNMRAMVFKCLARAKITHIHLGLMNQTHQFDWMIGKALDLNSDISYFGTVGQVHEYQTNVSFFQNGAASTDTEWVEIALSSPMVLEPGEYFIIQYYDNDLAGNPNTVADNGNDPNQGRLKYISSWNGGGDISERRPWLRKMSGWQRNVTELDTEGNNNPGPYNTEGGYTWAIDFRGEFY